MVSNWKSNVSGISSVQLKAQTLNNSLPSLGVFKLFVGFLTFFFFKPVKLMLLLCFFEIPFSECCVNNR